MSPSVVFFLYWVSFEQRDEKQQQQQRGEEFMALLQTSHLALVMSGCKKEACVCVCVSGCVSFTVCECVGCGGLSWCSSCTHKLLWGLCCQLVRIFFTKVTRYWRSSRAVLFLLVFVVQRHSEEKRPTWYRGICKINTVEEEEEEGRWRRRR